MRPSPVGSSVDKLDSFGKLDKTLFAASSLITLIYDAKLQAKHCSRICRFLNCHEHHPGPEKPNLTPFRKRAYNATQSM